MGLNRSAHVMEDISPDLETFFRVSLTTYFANKHRAVGDIFTEISRHSARNMCLRAFMKLDVHMLT
ncbi:hypothetical protein QN375_25680, partial [Pseudomonas sp. MH9.2]|uniref:hypothetical protein n=1 Tax=unclassified Pseudomonas TaxID=196821 RepID=UPI002B22F4AF